MTAQNNEVKIGNLESDLSIVNETTVINKNAIMENQVDISALNESTIINHNAIVVVQEKVDDLTLTVDSVNASVQQVIQVIESRLPIVKSAKQDKFLQRIS